MCLGIFVTLPTVASFLMLYTLRCGSITVLLWTILRASFTLFFFVVVVLEALVRRKSAFGDLFVFDENPTSEDNIFHLFYCSIVMIVAEAILIVFCYYLAHSIICTRAAPMPPYLLCRFIVWMVEITNLAVLTLVHRLLIGWYLGLLMFIILEFYGYIVVYSYYMEIVECYDEDDPCKPCSY